MTRYQIPREETSINLTNISEQAYYLTWFFYGTALPEGVTANLTLQFQEETVKTMHTYTTVKSSRVYMRSSGTTRFGVRTVILINLRDWRMAWPDSGQGN